MLRGCPAGSCPGVVDDINGLVQQCSLDAVVRADRHLKENVGLDECIHGAKDLTLCLRVLTDRQSIRVKIFEFQKRRVLIAGKLTTLSAPGAGPSSRLILSFSPHINRDVPSSRTSASAGHHLIHA